MSFEVTDDRADLSVKACYSNYEEAWESPYRAFRDADGKAFILTDEGVLNEDYLHYSQYYPSYPLFPLAPHNLAITVR